MRIAKLFNLVASHFFYRIYFETFLGASESRLQNQRSQQRIQNLRFIRPDIVEGREGR